MEAVIVTTDRAHYFRHSGDPCDYNTYLHSAAEEAFFVEFKHCLDYGKPFIVSAFARVKCDSRCVADKDTCSKRNKQISVDLTKKFSSISPEKRVLVDGHYRRPDLLLETKTGEQLWVEIWVRHKTPEEKLQDGNVLEIKVVNENDIAPIRKHELIQKDPSDKNIKLFLNQVCPSPELNKPYIGVEDSPSFNGYSFIPNTPIGSSDVSKKQVVEQHSAPKKHTPSFKPITLSHSSDFIKTDRVLNSKISQYWSSPNKPEWIDLGLPSGTLWSNNLMGIMTLDEARSQYPDNIPSIGQVEELLTLCQQSPDYHLIGPNGRYFELWEGDFLVNDSNDGKTTCLHRANLPVHTGRPVSNELCKVNAQTRLCVRLVK